MKGEFRWRNEEDLPLSLKRKLCLRHSAVKVPKRNCGVLRHNLSADQLSKWKQQVVENVATLFDSTDKHSDASIERIAQLEQLVGRLTLALEIEKKSIDFAELTPSEQRHLVETLRTDYSARQICETLGINKSTLYYQPKKDLCEEVLRDEIEQ